MATLLLQTAGAALGGLVGGPFGAALGQAIGGAIGGVADTALLTAMAGPRRIEGPRLSGFPGISAEEGRPIPRIYGRVRIGGQVIWSTRFVEKVKKTRTQGKFGVTESETTEYSYYANVAIGLCEGPIAFVRRIWADGKELDLTTIAFRVHKGSETQAADPLIVAKEGAANAPAYRGLAYVVFEKLPVSRFGNRLPQLSFEVVRPVDGLSQLIRAVNLIPGQRSSVMIPAPLHAISARADVPAKTGISASPRPMRWRPLMHSKGFARTSRRSILSSAGSAMICAPETARSGRESMPLTR